MALQGNLTDLPLVDLVQVLTLQTKNGILSVNNKFSQAQVCFSSHKIYSARVHHTGKNGDLIYLQGEAALYDLLRWAEGQFSFELIAALPDAQNVHTNWDYLVLEHCRRQDEAQKVAAHKLLDSCPHLSQTPSIQAEITLNLEEWRILLQVNGSATLHQIAATIRQPDDEVLKIAQHLAALGLLIIPIPALAVTRPVAQLYPQTSELLTTSASASPSQRPATNQTTQPVAVAQLPAGKYQPTPLLQMPPQTRAISLEKPKVKVQPGLLGGLLAKLRGL